MSESGKKFKMQNVPWDVANNFYDDRLKKKHVKNKFIKNEKKKNIILVQAEVPRIASNELL